MKTSYWRMLLKIDKMKNIYLLSILFLSIITLDCNAQQSLKKSKSDYDNFLRRRLSTIEEKVVSIKPVFLEINTLARMSEDIKFSKKDSADIRLQLETNNKFIYDSTLFPTKSFIEKTTIDDTYIKISRPIFFEKGKKLWVYIEHHCPDTCGEGVIEVYEVDKTKFKLLFRIVTWIS